MSDWKEFSAKTVNEALTTALTEMGTTSDRVEYEILEEEKTGLLGLFSKPALIRVRIKEDLVQEGSAESVRIHSSSETSSSFEKNTTGLAASNESLDNVASTFLSSVFTAMGMDVRAEYNYNKEERVIDIELFGDNMGPLIGKRGSTLDAIQYLTSLVVNRESDGYVKIKIDTENFRARRRETLENLAKNIAHKVKRTHRPVYLEPMNPYERRVIHSALQNDKYVETHSEGDEPYRKVVVTLKPGMDTGYGHNRNWDSYGRGRSYNRGGYRKKSYRDNRYQRGYSENYDQEDREEDHRYSRDDKYSNRYDQDGYRDHQDFSGNEDKYDDHYDEGFSPSSDQGEDSNSLD